MSGSNDWLGGYTLEELLGSAPVTKSKKELKREKKAGKRGIVATVVGAPFRLVAGLIKLPITIVTRLVGGVVAAVTEVAKLPFRLVGAVLSPWRKRS